MCAFWRNKFIFFLCCLSFSYYVKRNTWYLTLRREYSYDNRWFKHCLKEQEKYKVWDTAIDVFLLLTTSCATCTVLCKHLIYHHSHSCQRRSCSQKLLNLFGSHSLKTCRLVSHTVKKSSPTLWNASKPLFQFSPLIKISFRVFLGKITFCDKVIEISNVYILLAYEQLMKYNTSSIKRSSHKIFILVI